MSTILTVFLVKTFISIAQSLREHVAKIREKRRKLSVHGENQIGLDYCILLSQKHECVARSVRSVEPSNRQGLNNI